MKYDFIINGGGVAGLSLAMYMNENQFFSHKKILIIEANDKNTNDKTFCFWDTKKSFFEDIIYKKWNKIGFFHLQFEKNIDLNDYTYNMIRAIDFYQYCQKKLNQNKNITFLKEKSIAWGSTQEGGYVTTESGTFEAQWIFNSINLKTKSKQLQKKQYHYYLQHFKGWTIQTKKDVFDEQVATFMDFRLPQRNAEVCFMYLLPASKRESLVEYTIFGREILEQKVYENEILTYIHQRLGLEPDEYEIKEIEWGIIPMFDEPFIQKPSAFVMNIGAVGGATKASTGFTFHTIQKQTQRIIDNLIKTSIPFDNTNFLKKRFNLYDSMLLEVIESEQLKGADIFKMMFEKHKVEKILRFLDDESNFLEELQIMYSVPSPPFIAAFFRLLKKGYFKIT